MTLRGADDESTTVQRRTASRGDTPLHMASLNSDSAAIRTLLDRECDPNPANNGGVTPLHLACQMLHAEGVRPSVRRDLSACLPACLPIRGTVQDR